MFVEKCFPELQKRDELGRAVEEEFDWRFIPLGLAFLVLFWGVYSLITLGARVLVRLGSFHIHGVPVYIGVSAAVFCVFFAVLIFSLRDLQNWRSLAWLQILTSVVGGVLALLSSDLSVRGVLGFMAAAFTAANGFKRLHEIDATKRKQTTGSAA